MAKADATTLKELVTEALGNARLNDEFETIEIEEDWESDGSEFLRVFLTRKQSAHLTDDQLDAIASGIERTLGAKDERFASVFFPDQD